jgi:hypothetical protein
MVDDIEIGSSVTIENNPGRESFKIHPNPANDKIYIDFGDLTSDEINIEIYNMMGKLVMKYGDVKKRGANFVANISGLDQGIYLMKIQDPSGPVFKKFIIER